jgi:hypothetical protein
VIGEVDGRKKGDTMPDPLEPLLKVPGRTVYRLPAPGASVYLVADREAGGVLVNTPPFDTALAEAVAALAPIRYLFFPSRFGACDVDRWRAHSGARSLAFGPEVEAITGVVDIPLECKSRLTRTIDFLPMSGRTHGSCAMRLRNKPGVVFFGPVLQPGANGWPTLVPQPDDASYENRLIGVLGLRDVRYEYAFTDVFEPGRTRFGPGAGPAVQAELERVLGE